MTRGGDGKLGFWMSLAMVIGNVIGSGVYVLPATLAPFGSVAPVAWVATVAGTMCLAFAMARLAAGNDGGPNAYVAAAFGERAAFLTSWSYLVSNWSALAAVAIAMGGGLSYMLPGAGLGVTGFALLGLGLILAINLAGTRSVGWVQLLTVGLKLVPLVVVLGLIAWQWGRGAPLEPLRTVPLTISSLAAASALMFFSLTGFEAAAVAAERTRDPTRTVPLTTIFGTGGAGLIYLLVVTAVMMLVPYATLAASKAPFADAAAPLWGTDASLLIAGFSVVSAFGAGNSLMLMCGEISHAMAEQGDLPTRFLERSAGGAARLALTISSVAAGLLILAASSSQPLFADLFGFVTLVSSDSTLILYAACAAAALRLRSGWVARAALAVGIFYSLFTFWGAGAEAGRWSLVLLAAGWPVRLASRAWNAKRTAGTSTG
ncbi:amino acid permease [Sphingomonas ginkgonis]|uniref:Arginine/agmatine antiporter n=1 Tax=Sphingomonas ginkgonis TaxID=2315330 RepID=A0A3R9YNF5_9SPHN|nr:amino acid permease [Sphingomonas ginkgonis]RST31768.1 amino acid permease [Sphingomonas ginkgonis]